MNRFQLAFIKEELLFTVVRANLSLFDQYTHISLTFCNIDGTKYSGDRKTGHVRFFRMVDLSSNGPVFEWSKNKMAAKPLA